MIRRFETLQDFHEHGFDDVIDVRSPSEFVEDRLPGAINLPVLSDVERAEVGTAYVRESPFKARRIGAAMLSRNAARHLEGALSKHPGSWRPLLYCWRGGQRSGAFAAILSQVGWRVEVVQGGYRSYRRLVSRALYDEPWPVPVTVLDGNTGTAKTELLARVAARGGQVIDLEGLAGHRGSLFGGIGMQPSQKSFESKLALALTRLDPSRRVLVEAESSKIGDLLVPPALWKAMCRAPRIEIAAPLQARAAYLVDTYAHTLKDREQVIEVLLKLVPYHGRERVQDWIEMARSDNRHDLARSLMAEHYDPRYEKARARSGHTVFGTMETTSLSGAALDRLADRLFECLS